MSNARALHHATNDNTPAGEAGALSEGLGGPISGYFNSNNEVPNARRESTLPPTGSRRHHSGDSRPTTPQHSDPTQRQHLLLWRRSLVLIALDRSGRVEPVRGTPSTRSNNTSPARHGPLSAATDATTLRGSPEIAGPFTARFHRGSRHGATQPVTAFLNGYPVRPEGRRTRISACTHGKKWVTSYHRCNGRNSLITKCSHGDHAGGNPLTLSPSSCDLSTGCSFGPGPGKLELTNNSEAGETE